MSLIITYPVLCFAHSGRTDSSGGHRDNQNKSGLGYYHYHCNRTPPHLHEGGVCPYSSNYSEGSASGSYNPNSSSSSDSTVYASSIKITDKPKSLKVGEKFNLDAKIQPRNVDDDSIKWSSSDKSIATVNSDGKLTAKKSGTVTITAMTSNGKTASFELTIKKIITEKIEIQNKTNCILEGDYLPLEAKLFPEDTPNKKINWVSDNEDSVLLSKDGTLYAVKEGTATVYAKQEDVSDSFEIEVYPEIEAIDILSGAKNIRLKKGESKTISAHIEPFDTLNTRLTWKSQDADIAKLNGYTLTALKAGNTIITATAVNGVQDAILVQVYDYTPYIVTAIIIACIICIVIAFFTIRYIKRSGKPLKIKGFVLGKNLIAHNDDEE